MQAGRLEMVTRPRSRKLTFNRASTSIGALFLVLAAPAVLCHATPRCAESQTAEKASLLPTFEVASVKPSGPTQRELNGLYTYPGGRLVCRGCTLQYLVLEAFHVQQFQISGGPGWMNDSHFDIEAKPPESSRSAKSNPALPKLPPNDEQRQMLQSLLIERFRLQVRRTTKDGPVYVLTRGDKALKLFSACKQE
jgi:Protein of unknown function (DUF3738)